MKHRQQVLANWSTGESIGGASCPFCGLRTKLKKKEDWIVADSPCEHTGRVLSAGCLDVAIEFSDLQGTTLKAGAVKCCH